MRRTIISSHGLLHMQVAADPCPTAEFVLSQIDTSPRCPCGRGSPRFAALPPARMYYMPCAIFETAMHRTHPVMPTALSCFFHAACRTRTCCVFVRAHDAPPATSACVGRVPSRRGERERRGGVGARTSCLVVHTVRHDWPYRQKTPVHHLANGLYQEDDDTCMHFNDMSICEFFQSVRSF